MISTDNDEIRGIYNKGLPGSIKEFFPKFYENNKERVDNGYIIFMHDPWATETGVLFDLGTNESFIINLRA